MKTLTRLLALVAALAIHGFAHALTIAPFTPQAFAQAQQAGKPVAVHFHADWCPTCVQQEKAFRLLSAESGLDITLLVADYDKEKDLRRQMKVRSQSTLVVFRGADEKARSGGETSPERLRAVLKAAL